MQRGRGSCQNPKRAWPWQQLQKRCASQSQHYYQIRERDYVLSTDSSNHCAINAEAFYEREAAHH